MSQVNKFKQDQNPDFLYFDLQQTNVYNTTENIQQPLKFIETRDTPIVANSGDYHLSVTRFQLDTYNLPVLVVEPDLTQPTNTYDPNQSIYKVALIPKKSNIKSQVQSTTKEILIQNTITSNSQDYGRRIAFQRNSANLSVVVGQYKGNNLRGQLDYLSSTDDTTLTRQVFSWRDISGSTAIGSRSAGITSDGAFLISDGNAPDLSGNTRSFTLIWDRDRGRDKAYAKPAPEGSVGTSQISGDGTKVIVAETIASTGDSKLQSYIFNRGTGVYTTWGNAYDASGAFNNTISLGARGIGMSDDGVDIVVGDHTHDAGKGALYFIKQDYTTPNNQSIITIEGAANNYLGYYIAMSGNGLVVAASGVDNFIPFVKIYNKTTPGGVTTWTLGQTLSGGTLSVGDRLSLNNDGTILYVASHGTGTANTANVKRYKKVGGTYTFDIVIDTFQPPEEAVNVASNSTGEKVFVVSYDVHEITNSNEEYIGLGTINVGDTFNLPNSTENVPVIKHVIWTPDYKEAEAPNKNVLDGKNTAFYQYYYCNAYENFIARVNVAIREAYIALIEELYHDWVVVINNASLTNVFIDVVFRQFTPPPFLEWNEAELKAELYATLLFQTHNPPPNNATEYPINYSCNPDVVFSIVSSNRVGTYGLLVPFEFEIAMNAPLYSLFNSLPASKKVLTAPISLYKENYYTLNFFTTGNDLATPSVPLHTIPTYDFVGTYVVGTNAVQYPTQYTENITHANLLLKQPQELSTIDTWTPINAIVFTTTSLPIVVNQFSASSSIGDKPPSGSTSNEFAFIITDIQSNEQGFRPNVLYAPSAQFRYIDLTGNQPIRNIDISIFWRTTTGALIPMVLASGAQASIKLLFEKKDKSGQKEANGFIIDKGSGFNSSI